jgi:hypothetical protein
MCMHKHMCMCIAPALCWLPALEIINLMGNPKNDKGGPGGLASRD